MSPEDAHKFGIVSLKPTASGPLVNGLVEKPAPGTAPTNFYISGRYILQPEVFALLDGQAPGAGGEIQLTDALIGLMETQEIRPYEFRGQTFDCGSPGGFVGRQPGARHGAAGARRGARPRARPLRHAGAARRGLAGAPDARGCQEARAAVRFRVAPQHRIGFL